MVIVNGTRGRDTSIGFRLPTAYKAALQTIADQRGCDLSDLTREAVISYFALSERDSQPHTEIIEQNTGITDSSTQEGPNGL